MNRTNKKYFPAILIGLRYVGKAKPDLPVDLFIRKARSTNLGAEPLDQRKRGCFPSYCLLLLLSLVYSASHNIKTKCEDRRE